MVLLKKAALVRLSHPFRFSSFPFKAARGGVDTQTDTKRVCSRTQYTYDRYWRQEFYLAPSTSPRTHSRFVSFVSVAFMKIELRVEEGVFLLYPLF